MKTKKQILFLLLFLFICTTPVYADTVLKAISVTTSNILFSWTYDFNLVGNTDTAGFYLYYYPKAYPSRTKLIQIPGKVTSYLFKSFPIGNYYIYIKAYDYAGNLSSSSNILLITKRR